MELRAHYKARDLTILLLWRDRAARGCIFWGKVFVTPVIKFYIKQKYMQQLCYGSSGGDDVTALKEEIKERDELVAELSGDVTVLRAEMEALEKEFAECSKEKEHSKKEM